MSRCESALPVCKQKYRKYSKKKKIKLKLQIKHQQLTIQENLRRWEYHCLQSREAFTNGTREALQQAANHRLHSGTGSRAPKKEKQFFGQMKLTERWEKKSTEMERNGL